MQLLSKLLSASLLPQVDVMEEKLANCSFQNGCHRFAQLSRRHPLRLFSTYFLSFHVDKPINAFSS